MCACTCRDAQADGGGDPAPSGDTGSSRPEAPPIRREALCSALGTGTVCFRVFPEVTAVEAASPSAVTPCRAPRPEGDWSPSLLAPGLHHSVNKTFSLIPARCCVVRFDYPWDTFQ